MFTEDQRLIEQALQSVGGTRLIQVDRGVRHRAGDAFGRLFGRRPATIIADANTFAAAGRDLLDSLRRAGHRCTAPWVFADRKLRAESGRVDAVEQALAPHDAIPVAVGAGTINDLVKLAAHRLGRPYLVAATAASMDGYSAFGASITQRGSKQTFPCAAPAGILADLEVIESAPEGMNSWGYADLLAKTVAGADWLAADALLVEPIEEAAWEMVQSRLRTWVGDPAGVRRGDSEAVRSLVVGLVMSGLAMQRTKTSRPASGAEHQFSHLWDMQHHLHKGELVSHGFQVGIGALASAALYEELLREPLEEVNAELLASRWPDLSDVEADIRRRFDRPELVGKALEESRAKHLNFAALRRQLARLQAIWPRLRGRLRSQLMPLGELADRLAEAGCPSAPHEIGVSPLRLRDSYLQALAIRRRFTVLDLAARTGLLTHLLDRIFGPQGRWPIDRPQSAETGRGECAAN